MIETIRSRLRKEVEVYSYTYVSKKTGIHTSTLNNFVQEHTKKMSPLNIRKAAKYLKIKT